MELDILIQTERGSSRARMPAQPPFSVGRDERSGLRLQSDLVSRKHVVIAGTPGGLRVEDTSTNGTLAGGRVLHKSIVDIPFGTPIVVGEFTLIIRPADGASDALGSRPGPPPMPPAHGLSAPPHRPSAAPPMPPPLPSPGHPGGPLAAPLPPSGPQPPVTSGSYPAFPPGRPPVAPPGPSQLPPGGYPQGRDDADAVMTGKPPRLSTTPGVGGQPPGAAFPGSAPTHGAPTPHTPMTQPGASHAPPKRRGGAVNADVRREIHTRLIENLDLAATSAEKLDDPSLRPKVIAALRRIIESMALRLPPDLDKDRLVGELADEALGLGPLEDLLADPAVSEIMVVDSNTIYVERNGKITLSEAAFTDDERARAVIERIVTPLGRRIDESSPLVDARLKDGSRVNAVIKPIALRGVCITIRKFSRTPLTLEKLVSFGALTEQMGRFLLRSVIARKNIVISGGTGSGKTTLLNVLSAYIPEDERIVTIEDAAELQLAQPHVVSMETRPSNMEGKGAYTIRDLLKNAMRMRPDRIVVGECRGGEALDMLQAMNTGHDGSLTTTHANSPKEAIMRLETLCLMSGVELPSRAIREQIAGSVDLVIQQSRLSDGSRKVSAVSEVVGINDEGEVELLPIFEFVRTGTGPKGQVIGKHKPTGYLPSYLDKFIVMGLVKPGEPYL